MKTGPGDPGHPGIAALREEAEKSGLDRSRAAEKERRGPVSTAGG